MRTINNLLESAKKVNLSREIEISLSETSDEFVRIQREQMSEGLRSDDTPIFNVKTGSEYYSPGYAKYKGKESPIDLKDKGDFQEGIFAKAEQEGLFVDSEDAKSKKLQDDYGKEIFGLGTQSRKEYAPIAYARLVSNVEQEMNVR